MIVLKGRILTEINVFTPWKIQVESNFRCPLLHLKFLLRARALVVYTFPYLLQLHNIFDLPFLCSKYYYSTTWIYQQNSNLRPSTFLLIEGVALYSMEWGLFIVAHFLAVHINSTFWDSVAVFIVCCAVNQVVFPIQIK